MKDTSYKNKQFGLLGMAFLSVAGIAGCSKVELAQSTVTLELGDELSENVEDYLQNPDEKILKGASLDLSAVDETKVGSYNAAVAYDGKNYPFTVEVKDTTSPQCEAKDYIYMQPGTLTMDDLVTEIKDASETSSGIVSCEQKEDLAVCDYDDMLQEKAVVDTTDSYDGADYQESVQLDDEGCYEVTAQVKDSEGNFTDITLNVYVDGTAPELAQNVIDLDVDASGISIDDINTDDAEKIILKTEDGQNVKGYPCTPCIVGTWKDVYESEKILRNNADATSEGDKLSALTQRSFLVCAYGGLIEPISSGQEE